MTPLHTRISGRRGIQGQLKLKLKGKAPGLTTLSVNETEIARVGVFSLFSKFNMIFLFWRTTDSAFPETAYISLVAIIVFPKQLTDIDWETLNHNAIYLTRVKTKFVKCASLLHLRRHLNYGRNGIAKQGWVIHQNAVFEKNLTAWSVKYPQLIREQTEWTRISIIPRILLLPIFTHPQWKRKLFQE